VHPVKAWLALPIKPGGQVKPRQTVSRQIAEVTYPFTNASLIAGTSVVL